jgi:hypothetical protein
MATKPLADDETRLKKYSNLSRGEKQEIDLAKRAELAKAQQSASAGDSFSQRANDAAASALLAAPNAVGARSAMNQKAQLDAAATQREIERQERLQAAQDSANYKDYDKGLYGSRTPGKISDNLMEFKKGGKVKINARSAASKRADGIATKGHTKGRYI